MSIYIKRAYDEIEESDGHRILVDRLWPRGISKEQLQLYAWAKEIAPSTELRKWYNHDPQKFEEFKKRYTRELNNHSGFISRLAAKALDNDITLIYAAKNRENNQAVVLKEHLEHNIDSIK